MNAAGFKAAERLKFQIAPRKRRDGFTLNSAILSFPVWYQTLNEALSYARFVGRDQGCEIRINDSKGNIIGEIKIDEHQNRWINDLRLMRFATLGTPARRGRKLPADNQYTALETA